MNVSGAGRWVSFAKVAMEICSQDGNDHLYCNDRHRGSYYWDHCTALTAHCWETEVLVEAKEPMLDNYSGLQEKDQGRV